MNRVSEVYFSKIIAILKNKQIIFFALNISKMHRYKWTVYKWTNIIAFEKKYSETL